MDRPIKQEIIDCNPREEPGKWPAFTCQRRRDEPPRSNSMLRVGRRRCTGSTTLCARATGGAGRGLSRTRWGFLRRREQTAPLRDSQNGRKTRSHRPLRGGFSAVGLKRSALRFANAGTQRPKGAISPFFTWGVLHRRNGSLRFEIRKRGNSTAGFGPVHTIAIGFVPGHTSPHTSPRCHVSPTSSRRSVL